LKDVTIDDKFVADAAARNLREPTLCKYRLFFRQFQDFAAMYGLPCITDFDIDWARRFRVSWKNKNISALKKLEAFHAFFRFVHESGWISTNPASHLKPPRITEPPTAPFTREEVASILNACDIYPDKANALRWRALVESGGLEFARVGFQRLIEDCRAVCFGNSCT